MTSRKRSAPSSAAPQQAEFDSSSMDEDDQEADDGDQQQHAMKELALFGDRIRPSVWNELTFHNALNVRLYRISLHCRAQMPNMLFHGPRGAGKRTRVNIFVRSLFTERRAGSSAIDSMLRHQILTVDVSRKAAGAGSAAKADKQAGAMLGGFGGGAERTQQTSSSTADYEDNGDDGADAPLKRTSRAAPTKKAGGASTAANASASSSSTIEIACITSPYHLEVTPSDAGRKDIHVIRSCLRHLCQATAPPTSLFRVVDPGALAASTATSTATKTAEGCTNTEERIALPSYRVIIINRADKLSAEAQAALRCMMEQYAKRVRFVLICEHLSCILDAIQSRCLMVRVPRPAAVEMTSALANVASRAAVEFSSTKHQTAYMDRLLDSAHNDFTFAISLLEHNHTAEEPLTSRSHLEMPDWITVTLGITGVVFDGRLAQEPAIGSTAAAAASAAKTVVGPSVDQLQRVHRTFLELLSRCVPTNRLLHEMLHMFLDLVAQEQQKEQQKELEKKQSTAGKQKKKSAQPASSANNSLTSLMLLQRQICAIFAFFEPRIGTAHRPVIQLNALFVHLNELFSRHRAGLPMLAVFVPDDLFPRRSSSSSSSGARSCRIVSSQVPPLLITEQDILKIKRGVAQQ